MITTTRQRSTLAGYLVMGALLLAPGLASAQKISVVYHVATKEDVRLQSMGYGPRWSGGTINVNRILTGMLMVDVSGCSRSTPPQRSRRGPKEY